MDFKMQSAFTTFSARFLQGLDQSKSVIASPLSAEFLLALLTLGTTDPAHNELITCLGVPDDNAIRTAFISVSNKIKSVKGITLNVANKVYIMDGPYDLQAQLKEDALRVFDSDFEKVNFGENHAAAKLINDWVESKTNRRIKDLLSPDVLDDLTRLVLVNALYFKGSWKVKFDTRFTQQQPFHYDDNTTFQVPMMYLETKCRYWESQVLRAQLLELQYEGDESSMVIVLPYDVNGVGPLLSTLASGYDLISEINQMISTKVQVSIPKFKIESSIDLKQVLQKLGIRAIFDKNNSGLTKILNNKENIFVSTAVQKAVIEVNEEGAEAAAASAMVVMSRCAPMLPTFRADRPFLYMLLGPDRSPYFMGVYRGK